VVRSSTPGLLWTEISSLKELKMMMMMMMTTGKIKKNKNARILLSVAKILEGIQWPL
jgi:hypothetical protein